MVFTSVVTIWAYSWLNIASTPSPPGQILRRGRKGVKHYKSTPLFSKSILPVLELLIIWPPPATEAALLCIYYPDEGWSQSSLAHL